MGHPTNTTETYLPTATYDASTLALRNLRPVPLAGQVERHQLVELLGEVANIWPVTVLADPARGFELGRANLKSVG